MDINNTHIRRLDFTLLLVFQQLLRHRRTTVVADKLGLSQSAISHALSRLRDVFDEPLFLRRSDGMHPTQMALLLGPKIDALVELAAETLGATTTFDSTESTRLFRIATNDFIALLLGPALQTLFSRDAANARFSIRFAIGTEALEMLDADAADLVISRFDAIRPEHNATVLSEEAYRVVARKGHPRLKRGGLTLEKYLAMEHLLVSPQGDFYGTVDQALARLGLDRNVVSSVPMFLPALPIVSENDVIATVPERIAKRFAATFDLQHYAVPFQIEAATISLVRHQRSARDAGLDWLADVIRRIWTR
ncbi:MAG: LysR family transcriptional regulator [Rhodocyclales bacterium]|nr:LysR family transcriptional regulator [Rhodocyclales bacterium]